MKVAIGRAYLTVWRYHHARCDWQMAQDVLRGCDITETNARRRIAGILRQHIGIIPPPEKVTGRHEHVTQALCEHRSTEKIVECV